MTAILVLGSGQLGLMMAVEAARLGIELDRVDASSGTLFKGTCPRPEHFDLTSMVGKYDVITAEMEHLPDNELIRSLKAQQAWINDSAFSKLVDRKDQKTLLDKLGLATAPWTFLDSPGALQKAFLYCGENLVVKTTRGGYDGKGQWRVNQTACKNLPDDVYSHAIAESLIPFSREVSLVGARSRLGDSIYYPLATNVHWDGILRYSVCGREDNPALQNDAQYMMGSLMNDLDYVGVMAMECFESSQGLLINEIAPRVHNSGHWSQLGSLHNQFALHVNTISDLPFPAAMSYSPTLMINLIGCEFNSRWLEVTGIQCHWYGKTECRPGRKMGHINLQLQSSKDADRYLLELAPLLDETHSKALVEGLQLLLSRG